MSTSKSGHLIAKPSAVTRPPRNNEPVSPIKVFAGFQFQQRKPNTPPKSADERMPSPANLSITDAIINVIATVKVTLEQRPSIPSVRFTLF